MRKTNLIIAGAVLTALTLTGCSDGKSSDAKSSYSSYKPDGNPVVKVNGNTLYQSDLEDYIADMKMSAEQAQDRDKLIEDLVSRELVLQDALNKKVDRRPEVQKELFLIRQKVLLSAVVNDVMNQPITDEEIQAEYDAQIKDFKNLEYKASHILVKTKEEADKLIAELDGGADFAELAVQNSTGPSGKNGGDLGWFSPNSMVEPFANAVQAMEKGTYTKEPVETKFGWHIIQLIDSRNIAPPELMNVKPQIEQAVKQKRMKDYLDGLKAKGKVEKL